MGRQGKVLDHQGPFTDGTLGQFQSNQYMLENGCLDCCHQSGSGGWHARRNCSFSLSDLWCHQPLYTTCTCQRRLTDFPPAFYHLYDSCEFYKPSDDHKTFHQRWHFQLTRSHIINVLPVGPEACRRSTAGLRTVEFSSFCHHSLLHHSLWSTFEQVASSTQQ